MAEHRFLYCWFDTEYTQLNLDRAQLLEVAIVVTDDELRPVKGKTKAIPKGLLRKDGFSAFLTPPPDDEISDHVKENFKPLLERCRKEGRKVEEIDAYLDAYLESFPECRARDVRMRPVLAGNSVYADFFLARKYLPSLLKHLSYRLFDVTTFKIEWQYHYRGERFEKMGNSDQIGKFYKGEDAILGDKHDAYYDVQASIAELSYYRSKFKKL
jgi:oligoribonuclease